MADRDPLIRTWYLVANATRARIFESEAGMPLVLLASFEHPAGRLHSAQLGEDKAGREPGPRGFGGAAFEPRVSAHRKEHLDFAQKLAQHLERNARAGEFECLELFSSSPFLGELKELLGSRTKALLAGAHPVDLTRVGPAEMGRRIEHELAQNH